MEIPSNQSQSLQSLVKSQLNLDKIQTGQYLHAKVVEVSANKSSVIIRIGNQLLQAKNDTHVSVGDSIKVLVEKTTAGLILKIKPPSQSKNIIHSALRQLLPKQTSVNSFQQPLSTLLSALKAPSTSQTVLQQASIQSLTLQLNQLSRATLVPLVNNKNITSSGALKNAIQNSGIFLESKLQTLLTSNKPTIGNITQSFNKPLTPSAPGTSTSITQGDLTTLLASSAGETRIDLKANLVRLIQLLKSWQKQAPPQVIALHQTSKKTLNTQPTTPLLAAPNLETLIKELLMKSEGALSKITLNQLASTNNENTGTRNTWQIEIPLYNNQAAQSISLTIEHEKPSDKRTKKADEQWSVTLEMSPPNLGLIKNKLTFINQQINASFWAKQPETRTLIHDHLNTLRKQFLKANLNAQILQVQDSPLAVVKATGTSSQILNEKA